MKDEEPCQNLVVLLGVRTRLGRVGGVFFLMLVLDWFIVMAT